jgi:hypothetical protein
MGTTTKARRTRAEAARTTFGTTTHEAGTATERRRRTPTMAPTASTVDAITATATATATATSVDEAVFSHTQYQYCHN